MANRTITDQGADVSAFTIERTAAGFEVVVTIRHNAGESHVRLTQADILAAVPVAADRTTTRNVLGQLYGRALTLLGFA